MRGKLLLGLGLFFAATTPATAQTTIAAAKSEAILGTPSRLAALIAA
ncbi:hypothetical protein OMW55_09760 [Sphingomonas sp. BN140010]|uniref:Uncharacterized protein n=1 Tax=Sphingomonas arvum TaxID=2992113 RepID=A0ABT3JGB4_9SPHN|nr:hypothetical protein [Sphingomonas sp. BN140010]MCW3798088.1 hypothetical protein [Sphingomonas sp. BN140010]